MVLTQAATPTIAQQTTNDINDTILYLNTHHWSGEEAHQQIILWALHHLKAEVMSHSGSNRLIAKAAEVLDKANSHADAYHELISQI